MTLSKVMWSSVAILGMSCTAPDEPSRRIAVRDNRLGITALELARFDDNGSVFELRGLSAGDRELASVRLRIGDIPDLHAATGSEITLSAAGNEQRIMSREVHVFPLRRATEPIQDFLDLPEVSSTLEREANIFVSAPAATETTYGTNDCDPSYLNTTPTAGQCCYSDWNRGATMFISPSGALINRIGPRTPCTTWSGGSCSGASCYFGPNGFGRPSVTQNGWYGWITDSGPPFDTCAWTSDGSAALFPDATGTFATGQGCPGGDDDAGSWDY